MVLVGLLGLSRAIIRPLAGGGSIGGSPAAYTQPWWWIWAGISIALVLFAGIMSGLTLGLMSLGLVDLEVLQQSGTDAEKAQATKIMPVVRKQHQLLVTLLLCNAAAMEALPIFLDDMFNEVVAVILSVTFVLAFGEVIPQAVCSRHGLAVGADMIWLVKILMVLCWPIAYPVGKILDHLLGHNDSALFRRAQLKALVSIHAREAGKGGELTHDETTIIQGALDLTEKTALDSMTPIESTFSLDIHSKLDWEAMGKILARGHSRVPVYEGNFRNLVGVLLVKSLLTIRAEAETPVSAVSIRRIPRVPSDMPLYDILNEFQKGGSHMAAVTKAKRKRKSGITQDENMKPNGLIAYNGNDKVNGVNGNEKLESWVMHWEATDVEKGGDDFKESKYDGEEHEDYSEKGGDDFKESKYDGEEHEDYSDGEVIGIITLEDVMEELLQEEIVDETDEYIDVHKKVRVATATTHVTRGGAMLVRRFGPLTNPIRQQTLQVQDEDNKTTPDAEPLNTNRRQMGLSKQGQQAVNKVRQVEKEAREEQLATQGFANGEFSITVPLLVNRCEDVGFS